MSFIEIRGLRKVYRIGDEKVVALDHIDLDIEKGEIVCILGTSGSGKSTLLNMLAGLEKPTKGTIKIGKTAITKLSENRLALFRQKYVGFVFQSYNLLPTLTALENVSMPLMFKGISKGKRDKLARKMLKNVGLGSRYKHKPTQMSGGQQQRVGIARAFVAKPKIVFADEPTGNLDTHTTNEVMSLMVRMAREYEQTFIVVTHDREISLYADRVLHIIDGKIQKDERVSDEDKIEPMTLEEIIEAQKKAEEKAKASPTKPEATAEQPAVPAEPEQPAEQNKQADDAEQAEPQPESEQAAEQKPDGENEKGDKAEAKANKPKKEKKSIFKRKQISEQGAVNVE